jgi:hypothetical protein
MFDISLFIRVLERLMGRLREKGWTLFNVQPFLCPEEEGN